MSQSVLSSRQFRIVEPTDPFSRGTAVQAYRGKKLVGTLQWGRGTPKYDHPTIDGGIITRVVVHKSYRRQGVGTQMLETARQLYPDSDIRHSGALTEDGKAWSSARP